MTTIEAPSGFGEFLTRSAENGKLVNTGFEERLFRLVDVLQRISQALMAAEAPFELVGGLAVLIHVEEVDPSQAALTRDVDLMINRVDLDHIKEAASAAGFRFRHAASVDMLLYGENDRVVNAIHLVFSGESVKATQVEPNPAIRPEIKPVHGSDVPVISVSDLVKMKLSSFRDKDRVHVRTLDEVGLITQAIEADLSDELKVRLAHVRATD